MTKRQPSPKSSSKPFERGLVEVFTGDGKGKTSAALGVALRALGHNLRVYIIYFMKGGYPYGEQQILSQLPNISFFEDGETDKRPVVVAETYGTHFANPDAGKGHRVTGCDPLRILEGNGDIAFTDEGIVLLDPQYPAKQQGERNDGGQADLEWCIESCSHSL